VRVLFPSLVCNSLLCQTSKILCKACSQAQSEFGKSVKPRGATIQVHVSGLHADKKISLNISLIQVNQLKVNKVTLDMTNHKLMSEIGLTSFSFCKKTRLHPRPKPR